MDYGRLRGVSGNQSVLQMRIGDHQFVEFSHNGRCWSYRVDEQECPPMYEHNVHADKLRYGGEIMHNKQQGIRHDGSGRYKWQGRLARFIHSRTGIDHKHRRRY